MRVQALALSESQITHAVTLTVLASMGPLHFGVAFTPATSRASSMCATITHTPQGTPGPVCISADKPAACGVLLLAGTC